MSRQLESYGINILELHAEWLQANGYKREASSCKRQIRMILNNKKKKEMKRIKHNDLTHYFLRPHDQLPRAYLASCEKFFKELRNKHQAPSSKRQASSLTNK